MIGNIVKSKPIFCFGLDILLSFYIDVFAVSIVKGLVFATAYSVIPFSIYNEEHVKHDYAYALVSNQIKLKACPDLMQHRENQRIADGW